MRFENLVRCLCCFMLLVMATSIFCRCSQHEASPQKLEEIENGVYAVLKEGATRAEAETNNAHDVVMVYDRKYTDVNAGEAVRYVAIDTSSFVPLILEGALGAEQDGCGKTILSVTLKKEYVKPLEELTRAQLNGKVAILIGGEIITIHKIRGVITEGQFQVTRCTDNACEILKAKLTE